ncbi:unnamed protein product [Phaedon cochleariae]|uniref:E3 ubiquitin-protein ligase n=1 Tax=Phaedon cochleariae TaxID=80249 RepID=A0A9N9SCQ4_PHACE|nr:unnamed protein product [Phaedon cochleariae]
MVYYANPELLRDVLKNQVVSSHIAGMMASADLRIVVGALQMADILMTKLPDEFGVHFRREGVLHQFDLSTRSPSPSHVRLSDVLKRKRVSKRTCGTSRSKTRHDDLPLSPSLVQDLFTKAASIGNSTPSNTTRPRYSGSSSKTSFLQSLNPARWGRSMNSSHDRNYSKDSMNNLSKSASNSHITAGNREKTRSWIRDQASKFIESYSGAEDDSHPATNVITRLKLAIDKLPTAKCCEALLELRDILMESDISPFEALLSYLADVDGPFDRDQRLRIMLNVFAGCPLDGAASFDADAPAPLTSTWMSALVAKLNGCASQLEQFPVKWKGGTVKIDPLALVQAIERYLVVRGYGRLRDKDCADSDDGDSDDDIDDTLAGVVVAQTGARHKLQFLVGGNVLPYNMTVYQAVRQFRNAGIWVQTHVIYYRPLKDEPSNTKSSSGSSSNHSSRKGKGSSGKSTSRRKGDELWNDGVTPLPQSPLAPYLTTRLPDTVTIQDASLEVLCLLRILNALNTHWTHLYPAIEHSPIVPATEFLNRLLDMSPELSSSDSQERVTPRLDRRKRTISRDDILKQAEQALLEVQYENEVGTGLGPTLEFYALVSKELQKASLELWNATRGGDDAEYVHSAVGLFPGPVARGAKVGQVTKVEKLQFDGCAVEELGLDFVLPGHNVELMRNGKSTPVTVHNLHRYVDLAAHWTLYEGDCSHGWDVKTLMECCRPDHGYNADSRAIRCLFEVLSSYDREEQRMFQSAVPSVDGSPEDAGTEHERRRLPAVGDDLRELPQAARLFDHRGDAGKIAARRLRGTALFLLVVKKTKRGTVWLVFERILYTVIYAKMMGLRRDKSKITYCIAPHLVG